MATESDCLLCGGTGKRGDATCPYCDPANAPARALVETTRAAYEAARDEGGNTRYRQVFSETQAEANSRKYGHAAEYRAFIAAALAWDALVRPGEKSAYAAAATLIAEQGWAT